MNTHAEWQEATPEQTTALDKAVEKAIAAPINVTNSQEKVTLAAKDGLVILYPTGDRLMIWGDLPVMVWEPVIGKREAWMIHLSKPKGAWYDTGARG